MPRPTHPRSIALLALLGALLAPGCRAAPAPQQGSGPALEPAPPPPRAWTQAFQREAVLVADEIVIEGPADLLDHVALRQDPESTVYTTRTVPEGLLQELGARPDSRAEVRAQLDAWSLAALRRITVLQRPGEVPVTVRASGNAYWAAADGSDERRETTLVFQGLHGK